MSSSWCHIFRTFWKRENCRDRNQISGCQGLGLGLGMREGTHGKFWGWRKYFISFFSPFFVFFGGSGNIPYLDYSALHLKKGEFTVCKLYYNIPDPIKYLLSLLCLTVIIHGDVGCQAECMKSNLDIQNIIPYFLNSGHLWIFTSKCISLHLGNSILFPFGELLLHCMLLWWDSQSNPLLSKKWTDDWIFAN